MFRNEVLLVAALVAAGCGGRHNVPCEVDTNCDLSADGRCIQGPTEKWCAYPDSSCPSGYRFSELDVGDGVSGQCVASHDVDAGVDAVDAEIGDGNVSCKPRIAFADGVTGKREVWVTNPDGSGKQNVSNSAAYDDWRPSWSPDGTKLVFESNRTGNFDIFKVNADGSGLTNLTPSSSTDDIWPVWSPDGTKIAFVRNGTPWVMSADGSGPMQVSTLSQTNTLAWSPDSSKIMFAHIEAQSGTPSLYVVSLPNGSPVKVSPSGNFSPSGSWAPNDKIVFYSGGANFDVYTVNADGSGSFNVTQTAANESAPKMRGTTIVMSSDQNGKVEVWRVSNTGGTQSQVTSNNLTTSGTGDFVTDISSDGMLVAFDRRTSPTTSQIGVIRIDGSNIVTFDAGAGNARGGVFAVCP